MRIAVECRWRAAENRNGLNCAARPSDSLSHGDRRMIQGIMSFSTAEDLGALPDAEALARSRKEPELFALIVRRYEAALLRRARTILFSPEDAEEAVQDAFTKMYLYADTYRPQEGASFSSWAYTILNRVAYTKYRAKTAERGKRAEVLL